MAVILATNVPSVLDAAVLDRMDEAFEFPRREGLRCAGMVVRRNKAQQPKGWIRF